VLQPLSAEAIAVLLDRALHDQERGLGRLGLAVEPEALAAVALEADGDARRALTVLEAAAAHVGEGGTVTVEVAREAMQKRFARYDKAGEEHFNLLSAYHKSLRGSDPQGALYWMARMIDGGEDPMTLFRRAIAMAAEDIGLADPEALKLAVAARDAFHMLGAPEGYLPLSEMTIYLATAPKSNSAKVALDAALEAARETPAAPVPLHIRNAPTKLMKDLGYHAGYRYAHDSADAYLPQVYLPDELRDATFYSPGAFGFERDVAKRMAWWDSLRRRAESGGGEEDAPSPPPREGGGDGAAEPAEEAG
jgi:putative ATPase